MKWCSQQIIPTGWMQKINALIPFISVQMYVDLFTVWLCPEITCICGMQVGLDDLKASLA